MNEPVGVAMITPYEAIGHLVRLKSDGIEPPLFELPQARSWSRDDFRERTNVLDELRADGWNRHPACRRRPGPDGAASTVLLFLVLAGRLLDLELDRRVSREPES